jgi:hypothetical protein
MNIAGPNLMNKPKANIEKVPKREVSQEISLSEISEKPKEITINT